MNKIKGLFAVLTVFSISAIQCLSANVSIGIPLRSDDGGKLFYLDQLEIHVDGQESPLNSSRMLFDSCQRLSWVVSPQERYQNDFVYVGNIYGNGFKVEGRRSGGKIRAGQLKFQFAQMGLMEPFEPQSFAYDGVLSIATQLVNGVKLVDNDEPLNMDRTISLYLKPLNITSESGQTTEVAGALVLGNPNPALYKGEINYLPLEQSTNYARICFGEYLPLRSLDIIWPKGSIQHKANTTFERKYERYINEVQLDSSSVLHVGPQTELDWLHERHLGASKLGSYYIFADCSLNEKPDLVFTLGSKTNQGQRQQIVLRPEDYVVMMDEPAGCVSAFRSIRTGPTIWSFGTRAMRKYYIAYNLSENGWRIGFAEAA